MGKVTLDITTETHGPVTVLVVNGPVDGQTYDHFKQAVHHACLAPGARVLIDCTGLTYMNSKSFGLLSQYHRSMLAGMGSLALCSLNRKLVKTMDLLGLGQMLKMFDNREAAFQKM